MRILFIVCAFTAYLGVGLFTLAQDVKFLDGAHPMLYFSLADVKGLIEKASTTHKKIADRISGAGETFVKDPDSLLPPKDPDVFASVWNERHGNNLCTLCMYCVLKPENDKATQAVIEFMDRMASYPNWYVADLPKDEVPVGHSLTGFATAYDFLYGRLDLQRRRLYYDVIKKTTSDLYKKLITVNYGWPKQYIHNHSPSNVVALLLGALVVSVHEPSIAKPWREKSVEHLDFSMELFSYIVDGSVDEGVPYGTYTSRGLTQYVFLAQRHFGIDHTHNPWLKEHFSFLYYTLLPGYQRSLGISDANYNWYYGPESHLRALDTFALRNGHGNWLADVIASTRPSERPLSASSAQRWSTYHTEYIFCNSSIQPRQPELDSVKKLHIFSDWGVVTYGGGKPSEQGNTFLSFKSAALNGEAVQDIMYTGRYPERVTGWRNFNPGHEHPDQNSFVFAPNGRYLISDALYGPKFTFLDNTMVFYPSVPTACHPPWEGQVGECKKWLEYKLYKKDTRGEILTATRSEDMVFIAGEAAGAYPEYLGISSYFRGVLLLNPEILIVVDCVRLQPDSKTTTAGALFHNTWLRWENYTHLGFRGGKVRYSEGDYSMFSMRSGEDFLNSKIHNGVQPQYLREGPTNYINVTFALKTKVTHVVHIFSGPNYEVKSVQFLPVNEKLGVSLALDISGTEYKVNVATSTTAKSKAQHPVQDRMRVTGHGGFATVKTGSKTHYFGLDDTVFRDGYGPPERQLDLGGNFHKGAVFASSYDRDGHAVQKRHTRTLKSADISQEDNHESYSDITNELPQGLNSNHRPQPNLSFSNTLVPMSVLVIYFLYSWREKSRSLTIRSWQGMSRLSAVFLAFMTTVNLVCIDREGNNTCLQRPDIMPRDWTMDTLPDVSMHKAAFTEVEKEIPTDSQQEKFVIPSEPFIVMSSLPGSGGDLLANLFQDSNVTNYLPTSRTRIPVRKGNSALPNLCLWQTDKPENYMDTMGWFTSLRSKPILHFNQEGNEDEIIQRRLRENINAPLVLNDVNGFWTTKLPWISSVVGYDNIQRVFIVRDPRSWISMLLKKRVDERRIEEQLLQALATVEKSCSSDGAKLPYFYDNVKALHLRTKPLSRIEKLAMIWTLSTGSVLANAATSSRGQWPLYIARFEDILNDPGRTAADMFSKLGLPLEIRILNKLERFVKSEHYTTSTDGLISPNLATRWRHELADDAIKSIESISCQVMRNLEYECLFFR